MKRTGSSGLGVVDVSGVGVVVLGSLLVGVVVVTVGASDPKETEEVLFLHSTLQLKPCRRPFKKP